MLGGACVGLGGVKDYEDLFINVKCVLNFVSDALLERNTTPEDRPGPKKESGLETPNF